MSPWRFFLVLFTILLAGVLQNTNFLNLAGIKPNLLLVVLIAASFFIESATVYILLVLIAAILLKFQSPLELETVAFALLALAAGLIGKRLHWLPIFNNLVLVAGATILFYLLTEPAYLIGSLISIGIELVYNIFLGAIFFKLFEQCLKMSSMLKT